MVHNSQSIFSVKLDASHIHIFKQAARRHLVMGFPKKARLVARQDIRNIAMRRNFEELYGTFLDQRASSQEPGVSNQRMCP
jgi:hypothetical protein